MTEQTVEKFPLVAVITPVYNGGKYLLETMECVQAQSYPNLVHVVLDNASSDNTAEIISLFSTSKVPVLAHRNPSTLPVCHNWNAAMGHTPNEAKYVRLLCADDLMTPDFIERTVALAQQDDSILIVGTNVSINETPIDFRWPADTAVIDGSEMIRGFLSGDMGFFAVHTLMRRSVLDWKQPVFDPDMLLGFDFDTVLAVLAQGRFGMVHDRLGWVREHEGTLTSTIMRVRNSHYADFLTALYRHGPTAFGAPAFKSAARRYEYLYLRRLRRWRREAGPEAVAHHAKALAQVRGPIGNWDFLLALVDGGLGKLGFRRRWTGWPN